MTPRSCFALATRGLGSSLSPGLSAPAAQPAFPSALQEGGGPGLSLSLHRPAEGPLGLEWDGAATPQAFPPPASYPEACSAARARPASPASAAATPSPPNLPEPAEPSHVTRCLPHRVRSPDHLLGMVCRHMSSHQQNGGRISDDHILLPVQSVQHPTLARPPGEGVRRPPGEPCDCGRHRPAQPPGQPSGDGALSGAVPPRALAGWKRD